MCCIKLIFLHRQFWSELQILPFFIVLVCIILTIKYTHFQESVADFLGWVLVNLQTPPSQSSKQDLRQVCIPALFDCAEVCWENSCGVWWCCQDITGLVSGCFGVAWRNYTYTRHPPQCLKWVVKASESFKFLLFILSGYTISGDRKKLLWV